MRKQNYSSWSGPLIICYFDCVFDLFPKITCRLGISLAHITKISELCMFLSSRLYIYGTDPRLKAEGVPAAERETRLTG